MKIPAKEAQSEIVTDELKILPAPSFLSSILRVSATKEPEFIEQAI